MWIEDSGMWAPAFLFLFLLPLPFFSPDAITQTPPAPRPIPLCPDDVQPAPPPTLWPGAPPSPLYLELAPMHRPVTYRAPSRSSASTSPVEPQASCPRSSGLEHLPTCLRKTSGLDRFLRFGGNRRTRILRAFSLLG
jgi:hypothetical protein